MPRRALALLPLLAAFGCGGAGQSTPSPTLSPLDSSGGRTLNGTAVKPDPIFKPAVGTNTPLGALKPLAATNPLAKAADGKTDKESVAKLAKLDKGDLKLDDAYNYLVADETAPRATVGEKGASIPFPNDAKANPDGTYWIVDAETRRAYTLSGVKKEEGKPTTVAEAPNADLVHPTAEDVAPALGLVARADEATTGVNHALRILAKGVGTEGAPAAGARVRLKKTVADKGLPPLTKALLKALKKYGAVLGAGDGAPALPALADTRWTKEDEKAVAAIHLSDFELIAPAVVKPVSTTKSKP